MSDVGLVQEDPVGREQHSSGAPDTPPAHGLSAAGILHAWEWGQDKHPVDRAVFLLALAHPNLTTEQLQRLTVGQRNTRLLILRERTLGPTLTGRADCPGCGATLEFAVDAAAIRRPESAPAEYRLEQDGLTMRFRPVNSLDLAAIVGLDEIGSARRRLIECCLLEATRDGQPVAVAELPASALATLVEAQAERDPQAETRFGLTCAVCDHRWSAVLDVVSFFWAELGARAESLLGEVHLLARAYGWREADVLAMGESRRHRYLELVG